MKANHLRYFARKATCAILMVGGLYAFAFETTESPYWGILAFFQTLTFIATWLAAFWLMCRWNLLQIAKRIDYMQRNKKNNN